MLDIVDLHAGTAATAGAPGTNGAGMTEILTGINLHIKAGEVHAIMGPNGSGKSTLAQVLAGRDTYEVTAGSVTYKGQDLLALSPEDRARNGLFLSFQYPVVIPGVNNIYLLQASVNAIRKHRQQEPLDAVDFLVLVREKIAEVQLDESFLHRPVNEGFSGGEKKRNEILQMLLLEPSLAVLDETDSGLDIDALKVIAEGVNRYRRADRALLLITHYQRLLNYVEPDRVHVLMDGRIVKSGGPELARELEAGGYAPIQEALAAAR